MATSTKTAAAAARGGTVSSPRAVSSVLSFPSAEVRAAVSARERAEKELAGNQREFRSLAADMMVSLDSSSYGAVQAPEAAGASCDTEDQLVPPAAGPRSPEYVAHCMGFAMNMSQVYKANRARDDKFALHDCCPAGMSSERVLSCLGTLATLYLVQTVNPASNAPTHNKRVFFLHDQPFNDTLRDLSEEHLADTKATIASFGFPIELMRAVELESLVAEARRKRRVALSAYDFNTAVAPKPRLVDFLAQHEQLRKFLLQGLVLASDIDDTHIEGAPPKYVAHFLPGRDLNGLKGLDALDVNLARGLMDGLFGEGLHEFGLEVDVARKLSYAAGCATAGRPYPPTAVPLEADVAEFTRRYFRDGCDGYVQRLVRNPLSVAAMAGNVGALEELRSVGWDVPRMLKKLVSLAIRALSREVIDWLRSFDATLTGSAINELVHAAFRAADIGMLTSARAVLPSGEVRPPVWEPMSPMVTIAASGRNDLATLRWLHEELGFPLHPAINSHALELGNLEMLYWYSSKLASVDLKTQLLKLQVDGRILASACKITKGDVRVLDSLLSWTSKAQRQHGLRPLAETAAWLGHTHVLEWLRLKLLGEAFSLPRDVLQCALTASALSGSVECARWVVNASSSTSSSSSLWSLGAGAAVFPRSSLETSHSSSGLIARRSARPLFPFQIEGAVRAPSQDLDASLAAHYDLSISSVGWLLDCVAANPCSVDTMELETGVVTTVPSQEMLDLLAPHFDLSCYYNAAINAADIKLARRLMAMGYKYDDGRKSFHVLLGRLLEIAPSARPGRVEFLRYLVDECRANLNKWGNMCIAAARSGDVETLAFVAASGGGFRDQEVLLEAAKYGHLPLCRWLRDQGAHCSEDIAAQARDKGADEVAAWIGLQPVS